MKLLCKISVALGVFCILCAVVLTLAYGCTAGNALALTAGAAFVALGWFYRRFPRWAQRTVAAGTLAVGVFFAAMITVIAVRGGQDSAAGTEDYILVLGCGIRGEEVLPTLRARLDRCMEYMAQNPQATVVVSGGRGRRETVSEAAAMKKYLAGRGIDPARIITEEHARDTRQNMRFSRHIFDSLAAGRPYSVACVTSRYHVMRSAALARREGLDARFAGARTAWYLWPSAYFREVLSVVKYWIER